MSKRLIRYIFCVTVFFSSTLDAQEDALSYYTVVRTVFSDIQDKSWDYTCSAAHGKSTARVEEKRKKVGGVKTPSAGTRLCGRMVDADKNKRWQSAGGLLALISVIKENPLTLK